MMAKTNKEYNTVEYWESRYKEDDGLFDWFGDFAQFENAILEFLDKRDNPKILHLGCGNSVVGERIYQRGYRNISNIDYSAFVIATMEKKYANICPEMEWIVCDIFELKPTLGTRLFDFAIDKGTLDSLLTVNYDQWDPSETILAQMESYMEQVAACMQDDGTFLHLTWSQPHFRKRLLEWGDHFDVTVHTLKSKTGGFEYFLYEARKKSLIRL